MISKIFESYRRWRHTRGFGVHSPFAYSIVKGVVRPDKGYSYYGYSDIEDTLVGMNHRAKLRRLSRMLLRLASTLNPQRSFLPNSEEALPFHTALLCVNSKMKITSALSEVDKCDLVCSSADYVPLSRIISLLNTPKRVVAIRNIDPNWISPIFESLSEGLILQGKKHAIIFNRPGMHKLIYTVNI